MAREIPEAVRAAAGLTATVLDEVRRLPETLPGLPVRVLGMAMQMSMKLQQHYADLVARGDELFTGIRGEDEPGLATFDDDDADAAGVVATAAKVGTSAFDRVAETVIEVTEDDDTVADAATTAEEILDELAIEELVDETSTPDGAEALADALLAGDGDAAEAAVAEAGDDATGLPEPETVEATASVGEDAAPDVAETLIDVPAPDGGVETVEATVTDEGIAAPEATPEATPEPATATDEGGTPVAAATDAADAPAAAPADEPEGGSAPSGSQAPATAPVDGYDDWSIAQLRGRLRGYQLVTVAELVSYEEANRSREPYLRMLRNRLSKLEEQAVESSPLAPRG
jgi:hypothetical protein